MSFYRQRGTVTSTRPYLMVRVDGDTYPMRMGERECVRLEERPLSMTGAE